MLRGLLNHLFGPEDAKVYFAGITGTATASTVHLYVGIGVGVLTGIYVLLKIIKYIRDWKRPANDE